MIFQIACFEDHCRILHRRSICLDFAIGRKCTVQIEGLNYAYLLEKVPNFDMSRENIDFRSLQ